MKKKTLKELSEKFGVNITVDKSLDKYSNVDLFPEKTRKAREILAKTRLKLC